jgi:hypothetical protein
MGCYNIGDPLSAEEITKYRSVVGALQYLSHTRPDLAFSINKACQYLNSPMIIHWTTVKHILCYIKLTLATGLRIQKSSSLVVSAFFMLIGWGVLMIVNLLMVMPYYFDLILFHGVPRSNQLCHTRVPRLSINL